LGIFISFAETRPTSPGSPFGQTGDESRVSEGARNSEFVMECKFVCASNAGARLRSLGLPSSLRSQRASSRLCGTFGANSPTEDSYRMEHMEHYSDSEKHARAGPL